MNECYATDAQIVNTPRHGRFTFWIVLPCIDMIEWLSTSFNCITYALLIPIFVSTMFNSIDIKLDYNQLNWCFIYALVLLLSDEIRPRALIQQIDGVDKIFISLISLMFSILWLFSFSLWCFLFLLLRHQPRWHFYNEFFLFERQNPTYNLIRRLSM